VLYSRSTRLQKVACRLWIKLSNHQLGGIIRRYAQSPSTLERRSLGILTPGRAKYTVRGKPWVLSMSSIVDVNGFIGDLWKALAGAKALRWTLITHNLGCSSSHNSPYRFAGGSTAATLVAALPLSIRLHHPQSGRIMPVQF
jgi:hypothetical protein